MFPVRSFVCKEIRSTCVQTAFKIQHIYNCFNNILHVKHAILKHNEKYFINLYYLMCNHWTVVTILYESIV